MKVTVCIGSSCHIKGSRKVVESLQELIAKENLGEHFLEGTEVRKNYLKAARHSPLRAAG